MGHNDKHVYFEEVRHDTPEYAFIERLMEQSFPEEERPDAASLRRRMENPLFHCFVIKDHSDKTPVGLVTYWTFGDFVYIEHLAIEPSVRGHSIGGQTIMWLIKGLCDKDMNLPSVLLEVEHPTTEDARRRIAFYERQGLRLWPDVGYKQPTYRHGGAEVPMLLMSTPNLDPTKYSYVRKTLYRYVYGVNVQS